MSERLRRLESVAAPLVVCATGVLFVAAAWGLRGDAGRFPVLVGSLTAALALAEAVARAAASRVYGAPPRGPHGLRTRAALLTIWFVAMLAGLYLLGVFVSNILFTTIYFRLFAGWRIWTALIAGLAHAAAFWIGFEVLAGFRLHHGVLIGG